MILWGADEEDLAENQRDDTGLRKTGRAKPYEQRDEADKVKK